MSDKSEAEAVQSFYDGVATNYGDRYRRENLWTHPKYPANYFRHQILLQRLATTAVTRIYEVGVGEGTPLSMLAKMGYGVAGCDISAAMVDLARKNLDQAGVPDPSIIQGDIEDIITLASQLGCKSDAVVAFGVLPHVANPSLMLRNVSTLLHGSGKVFIEFRNQFFSLFTFNRMTHEFIVEELLAGVGDDVREVVSSALKAKVNMQEPAVSSTADYSSIRAHFHNPLQLPELFERAGFRNLRFHWYHYHPAPPGLEPSLGRRFREEAFKLEHTADWRGMFLCSAGIVEADIGP